MGHWNYRVCKKTYNVGKEYEEVGYEIHEAYYNSDGTIWGITENGKSLYGDSIEDLKLGLENMLLALNKEVIDLDTFVPAKAEFDNNTEEDLDAGL